MSFTAASTKVTAATLQAAVGSGTTTAAQASALSAAGFSGVALGAPTFVAAPTAAPTAGAAPTSPLLSQGNLIAVIVCSVVGGVACVGALAYFLVLRGKPSGDAVAGVGGGGGYVSAGGALPRGADPIVVNLPPDQRGVAENVRRDYVGY